MESIMKNYYKLAAATVGMTVACSAWGGVTPLPENINIPPAHVDAADADAHNTFLTVSHAVNQTGLLVAGQAPAPVYVSAPNGPAPTPPDTSAAVTAVPLPPAAP